MRLRRLGLIFALLVPVSLWAHDTPVQLPPPQSIGEAWNVIEESATNVDSLIEGHLLRDVSFQMANIAPAIEFLRGQLDHSAIVSSCDTLLNGARDLVAAVREKDPSLDAIKTKWTSWRKLLAELESQYPPATVHSAVYICSMHPLDRHLSADERCSKCGMFLIRRHLPASTVYEKPGAATMKVTIVSSPLVVGKSADVRIRVAKSDGSPVQLSDLLEVHTQKIHLLINDASLSDYHHEHPKPTDVPGEYAFSFTPSKPGPYRVWADLVPVNSGIQEYDIADIAAETTSLPLSDRETRLTATVNGRTYKLTLEDNNQPIHAGQTVVGAIEVTGADGKPFNQLEPVMGAFAHIVGFSEDRRTVVHIHPYGQIPLSASDRGGPAFAFKLYVPKAGFVRLYVQVQIDGKQEFAPFGLTIAD